MTIFNEFIRSAAHEIRYAISRPGLFLSGVAAPLFWWAMLAAIFAAGLMRSLPVALVDNDNSPQSRELIQTLEAIPSISFKNFSSPEAAREALAAADVYAMLVVPGNWAQKSAGSRSDSALELYLNKSYYAIAVTIESDLKTALMQISSQKLLKQAAATGGGLHGSAYRIMTVGTDIFAAGNPAINFEGYLTATLVPGVMALAAILTGVGVASRDMRRRTARGLLNNSRSVRAVILGRIFPWWCLYAVYAVGYVSWFAGWCGWAPAGSLLVWCAGAVLLMSAMFASALMFTILSPSWILAMSAAICWIAPTFPFTGFSYPIDSMDASAQIFSSIFPLTWFLRLQSSQWVLASGLEHTLYLLTMLSAFVVVPLAVSLTLLPWRASQLAKAQMRPPKLDILEPRSAFETGLRVLVKGAFSRDTFAIFLLATAFYLVFYAWPYANQSITSIETVVVDLDRTASSRSLLQKLDSSASLKIVATTADPAQAKALYQTEAASAVITIPKNYEADLLGGKLTAVRLTTNGAFPVKSRAVSAALMSIAAEQTMQAAAVNMLRAGAPVETLAKLKTAPAALVDQNLFNVLSGYAGYIVPVVTPVIIQAVLLMGITMAVGGWLAENPVGGLMRAIFKRRSNFWTLYAAFWVFGMLWIGYAMGIDFVFFDFSSMQNPPATLALMALFISAVVSFGLACVFAMNSNAYCAQMLVVISAPSVFLSGAVFPAFDFAWPAALVRLFIPTTPGINGLVAAAQNAASFSSIWPQALHLGILAAGYGLAAYWLYLRRAQQHLALGSAKPVYRSNNA